ncbi:MAG: radical SAM protein [Anaerolineae bacterium]
MSQEPCVSLVNQVMNRARANLVPLIACLELTYRCNLRCVHCYIDEPLRAGAGELSTEEWCQVLDQLRQAGTLSVLLTGGELLCRPDAMDIWRAAKEKGFLVRAITNATRLDDETAQALAAVKPDLLVISIYGARAETHDAVTEHAGSFDATIRAVRLLSSLGVRIRLQGMLLAGHVHEGESIEALAASLGVGISLSCTINPSKKCLPAPQNWEAQPSEIQSDLSTTWLLGGFPKSGPKVCAAGQGIVAINPYGDVYPCMLMPMVIGNIRERAFSELWRTDPTADLQAVRSLVRADLTECQACTLAPYCDRCPGVALSESGSLTSRSASACRHAAIRVERVRKQTGAYL